jgi:hypothetical protein
MASKPELDPSVTPANRVEKARQFFDEAINYERTPADRKSSWGSSGCSNSRRNTDGINSVSAIRKPSVSRRISLIGCNPTYP